jgi:hypothetical protein
MADFNSPLYIEITRGLAAGLFQPEWANAAEAAGHSLSQQKIEEIAPETPDYALHHAAYVIGQVSLAHGLPLASIYAQACAADGVKYEEVCRAGRDEMDDLEKADALMAHARDFGFNLGMMATGSGVSWFDDHEHFLLNDGLNPPRALKVPLTEFHIDPLPPVRSRDLPEPSAKPAQDFSL